MRVKFLAAVFAAVVIAIGGYMLATWEIPVPAQRVEKPIADERLPR